MNSEKDKIQYPPKASDVTVDQLEMLFPPEEQNQFEPVDLFLFLEETKENFISIIQEVIVYIHIHKYIYSFLKKKINLCL